MSDHIRVWQDCEAGGWYASVRHPGGKWQRTRLHLSRASAIRAAEELARQYERQHPITFPKRRKR